MADYVKFARGLTKSKRSLLLISAWKAYCQHPVRATHATVHEQNSCCSSFYEFIEFVNDSMVTLSDITPELTDRFGQ